MSYIAVFFLVSICIICIVSAGKKIREIQFEENEEIRNQNLISSVGLLFFGGAGLIALLYVVVS